MNKKYLITSLIILLTSCTINQQNRIHELVVKQTGAYSRTKDIQIVLDRCVTDEFSLSLSQGVPLLTGKGEYPVFVIKGDNIPLNEQFIFAKIDQVTGKIDPQCEFEAREDGYLVIYGKNGISKEKEIPFVASDGFKAGYPIEYAIVSKKTYKSASIEFIPYPIKTKGDLGETVEATVSHPMGTHLQVKASGFLPLELLVLTHTTGDLKDKMEIAADETGAFEIGLNPTILGKLGGEASLVIERSGGKQIALDYPWGWGIEQKTWKEKSLFPMLFVANREPEDYTGLTALLE